MLYPVAIFLGDDLHAHGLETPDIPGCFSACDELDDALAMAWEAAAGCLEMMTEQARRQYNHVLFVQAGICRLHLGSSRYHPTLPVAAPRPRKILQAEPPITRDGQDRGISSRRHF